MTRSTASVAPIYPGEILREDFMKPLAVSINRLARVHELLIDNVALE